MASSTQTCTVIDRAASSRSSTAPAARRRAPRQGDQRRSGSTSRIGRLVPVADAPDGDDPLRLGRVGLDLLPQPSHVHGHGGLVAERPAPDLLQQLGPRRTPGPGAASGGPAGRTRAPSGPAPRPAGGRPGGPGRTTRSPSVSAPAAGCAARRRRAAAPNGPAAPAPGARTAWSRSRPRRAAARGPGRPRRRSAVSMTIGTPSRPCPQPPAHLQPVDAAAASGRARPGRARCRVHGGQCRRTVGREAHLETVVLQVAADDVADGRIVVDHQHALCHGPSPSRPVNVSPRCPSAQRSHAADSTRTSKPCEVLTAARGNPLGRTRGHAVTGMRILSPVRPGSSAHTSPTC